MFMSNPYDWIYVFLKLDICMLSYVRPRALPYTVLAYTVDPGGCTMSGSGLFTAPRVMDFVLILIVFKCFMYVLQ